MFLERGLDVVGIDNDMRGAFFGPEASTRWQVDLLTTQQGYTHHPADIRNAPAITRIFARYGRDIEAVIHCAAQPSHDWAVKDPVADFTINANGTQTLLEVTRQHAPDAAFMFVSTNKVYGDRPNHLPLVEQETRFELAPSHEWAERGFPEEMPIDACLHSLFGASKVAADVLTQEYGKYFGMKTGVFRGGCLTGPHHAGVELHGFLNYLVLASLEERPYTIFGYKGKQVRDQIHARDVIDSFWAFAQAPRPGEVYNLGGGKANAASLLECVEMVAKRTGKRPKLTYSEQNRVGDHICYYSDLRKLSAHYPGWKLRHSLDEIIDEMVSKMSKRS